MEQITALSEARKGMKKAKRKADPVFVDLLKKSIIETAKRLMKFTVDDVRQTFTNLNPEFEVEKWSVIGPLMKEVKEERSIEPGQFVRSKLPQSHGHHVQIWYSNIFVHTQNTNQNTAGEKL